MNEAVDRVLEEREAAEGARLTAHAP